MHLDCFLMGINREDPEVAKITKDLQREIDFGEVKYARTEKATFCGRSYQQETSGSINVTIGGMREVYADDACIQGAQQGA